MKRTVLRCVLRPKVPERERRDKSQKSDGSDPPVVAARPRLVVEPDHESAVDANLNATHLQ